MKTKIFKTLALVICTIYFSITTNAQLPNFTKIDTGSISQLWGGHVASTCFDIDNDGDLDIFSDNTGVYINRVFSHFKNEGNGYYIEMSKFITNLDYRRLCSYGDVDNDGDKDLFASKFNASNFKVYTNDGAGNFQFDNSCHCPDTKYYPTLLDLNNDGYIDLMGIDIWGSVCYNNGNGEFLPWEDLGLFQVEDNVYLHGVSWGDADDDGDLDFFGGYTSSGGIPNNLCYLNNGDGSFTQFDTTSIIVEGECTTTCVNWVDYDNDGDMDLYVHNVICDNMLPALYENLGNMNFTRHDIVDEMYRYSLANSSVWGDLDNDADLDLFITVENNDFPWPPPDTSATPINILYLNEGNGQFTNVLEHPLTLEDSHTALIFDHDNDGDLDVLMTRYSWSNDGYNNLFVNDGNENNWVVIDCEGTISNRSAIGTRLHAKSLVNDEHITQTREITPLNGHLSYANLRIHFGLGDAEVIDTLIIHWPSGIVDEYFNVPANKFYQAVEDEGIGLECLPEGMVFTSQSQIDHFQTDYPNCIEISGDVEISGSNITNLDGLSNIQVIDGDLDIHTNELLENLSGLDSLVSIHGDFVVTSNVLFEDFSGLENLTSIAGDLRISGNGSLTSLTGLENISPESIEGLTIAVNENLSYCHVESICYYLYNGPNGSVIIQDNADGCNDSLTVRQSCDSPVAVDELKIIEELFIHPNPFIQSVTIEYELQKSGSVQINIYNHHGKQVDLIEVRQQKGLNRIVWTPENLADGVYYFRFETGKQITSGKMLLMR